MRTASRTSTNLAGPAIGPPLTPGMPAPAFDLRDSPYSRVSLADLRGRPVVIAFHVADWHPVAAAQLARLEALLPELGRLSASVVAISTDATWSHDAFARAHGLTFPLLADDEPPGSVARAYGLFVPRTGRSRRALVVVDAEGVVRWSARVPDAVEPDVEGVLSTLELLLGE